ncbi:MAG: hypothetical protein LDL41_17280 [Coleofasciculus sp. S288]|nr:hypothetical protein [Coleofasciculus sp. S288]
MPVKNCLHAVTAIASTSTIFSLYNRSAIAGKASPPYKVQESAIALRKGI